MSWQIPRCKGKLGKALYKLKTLGIFGSRNIFPGAFLSAAPGPIPATSHRVFGEGPLGKTAKPQKYPLGGNNGQAEREEELALGSTERWQHGSLAIMKVRSDTAGGGGERSSQMMASNKGQRRGTV